MTRELDQAPAIAAAEDEIMRISYESLALAGTKTFVAWQADWAACADPAKGAEFTVTSYSDCISFTGSLSKMRFQLPAVDSAAPFARVIGVNNLQTDAAVEVIITLQARGNVLPFGLPGSAADETEICRKTGANPKNVPPCDGPDTGNFQFLDISEYGNEEMNTSTVCAGQTNTRLARNIARGVDHPILEAANNGLAYRVDITGCTQGNINYGPYSLTTDPGNKVGVLDNGFIDGVSGLPGRFSLSSETVLLGGKTIDDEPLWEYLNAAGQTLCGAVSDHDAMAACLASWSSGDGMIFDDSLADSPRFGWVPLFWNAGLGAGATTNNMRAAA